MILYFKKEILQCRSWDKTLTFTLKIQVQKKQTLVFSKSLCANLQERQIKLEKVEHLFTPFFVVHNKI